jgi:dihydroxy-acid dehydratase
VHTLVNLMPNGKYLMEDFCYAGGLPVVIRELGAQGLLNKDASPPTASRSGTTTRTRATTTRT